MRQTAHRITLRTIYVVWMFIVPTLALGMSAYAVFGVQPAIDETIRTQKVCTEGNQSACEALFDRLAVNLSRDQRQRLACDVTAYLSGPGVAAIRRETHCPAPIHPPLSSGG